MKHIYSISITLYEFLNNLNLIGNVMDRVFDSSVVDPRFEPRSGQIKDNTIISIYFLTAKHTALRSKIKDWLGPNQDNVSTVDCCFSELAL